MTSHQELERGPKLLLWVFVAIIVASLVVKAAEEGVFG